MYKSRGINRYQPDFWRLVREIAARCACRCTSETCTSRTSPFCRKCGQAALTAARMATADGRPVRDQDKVYPPTPCKNGPGRGFYGKKIHAQGFIIHIVDRAVALSRRLSKASPRTVLPGRSLSLCREPGGHEPALYFLTHCFNIQLNFLLKYT